LFGLGEEWETEEESRPFITGTEIEEEVEELLGRELLPEENIKFMDTFLLITNVVTGTKKASSTTLN
jgi:hypothetical protein